MIVVGVDGSPVEKTTVRLALFARARPPSPALFAPRRGGCSAVAPAVGRQGASHPRPAPSPRGKAGFETKPVPRKPVRPLFLPV
jgi:hypothetical protein